MNTVLENNKQWIDETWQKIEEKLRRTSVELKDKIPKVTTNGVYDDLSKSPGAWTNGFWPGIMWLMYAATKDEKYKAIAEDVEKKLDAWEKGKVVGDYKSELQQIIQQSGVDTLAYVLVGTSGPDHEKVFEVEARLNSNIIGRGKGRTKREAEQYAAKEALALFGEI
jgi:hypothetical protein